jgi:hypothetical protein
MNYFSRVCYHLRGIGNNSLDDNTKNTENTCMAEKKLIQWWISADAFRRIKVAAVLTERGPGEVVTELAERNLPPVEEEIEGAGNEEKN